MPEVYRSGAATVIVEQGNLRRALDRVSDGAASSFISNVDRVLDPIRDAAVQRWPVATGRSKRAFQRVHNITENHIEVAERNTARSGRFGFYAFRIRFSVRTRQSLEAEVERMAARGKTPASQDKLRQHWRKKLKKRHGDGAPTEALAGQQPWRRFMRNPANRAVRKLVPKLRQDLDRLARGA